MNSKVGGVTVLLLVAMGLSAGEVTCDKRVKELEKMIEDAGVYVETAKKGVVLGGWVDASYTYNLNGGGTDSGVNGSPGPIRTHALDIDSNDFNVNQVDISLDKALPEENTWAAGFHIDIGFGEDIKRFGENEPGLGSDSVSVIQAHVNFRVPVGTGLDFKIGKFCSPMLGFEVIPTPANINVSRSYWATLGAPLTHTGFLMSYEFSDWIDMRLGLVNGWNNGDSNFLDGFIDGDDGDDGPSDFAKAILAGIALHAPGGNAALFNNFLYSTEGDRLVGMTSSSVEAIGDVAFVPAYENAGILVWNIWGQWTPLAFKDRLLVGFNAGIGKAFDNHQGQWIDTVPSDAVGIGSNTDTWWGIATYAKYRFTDTLTLALRGEYFSDGDGTARIQDLEANYADNENWSDNDWSRYYVNSTDLWSLTATIGIDLWENMLMRLEYRLDIASSDGGNAIEAPDGLDDGVEQDVFGNNQGHQHTFILNLSYIF